MHGVRYTEVIEMVMVQFSTTFAPQIQGQMAIANKPWYDFCVWTPNGLAIDRIERDTDFWQQKMFSRLQTF